jgi:hypothetical protein
MRPDGTGREVETMMSQSDISEVAGRHCRLLRPVRDHEGRTRFGEQPTILRQIRNLDRSMYLVQFADGATTFLFPDEVAVE